MFIIIVLMYISFLCVFGMAIYSWCIKYAGEARQTERKKER